MVLREVTFFAFDIFNSFASGYHTLYGGLGNDSFNIKTNNTKAYGNEDDDIFNIFAGTKNNLVDGGIGNKQITNNGTNTTTINVPTSAALSAAPTFTGTTATLSHTVTQGSVSASGSYQPTGTIGVTLTVTTGTHTHSVGTTATTLSITKD